MLILAQRGDTLPKGWDTLHKREGTPLLPHRALLVLQGTEDPPQNLQSRGARGEDCF